MRKILTIVISIMIVAGISIALIFSLIPDTILLNDNYLAGNTAGNLNNGGLFCESNGKVYFSNSYDDGKLYVMNPDETDIKKIIDLPAFSINVGGDYIYFCQSSSQFSGTGFGVYRTQPGLYRSKTDGNNIKTLIASSILTATLCGNEIYYQHFDKSNLRPTSLYKIGTDGEGDRQISTEIINPSSYANGYIYYTGTDSDHFVYTLDVQNDYSTLLFEANAYNAIYEAGYVYFMDLANNYRLCRYSVYDNVIEILTTDRIDFYNIGNGVIVYQKNSRTEPAIFRMNQDGSNPEIIREGNHNNINMTSNYIYFQSFGDDITIYKTPLYGSDNVTAFTP